MNLLDQFKVVFAAMPVAALIVDRHGAILFCNGALVELFGYEDDELIGRPVEVLIGEEVAGRHVELRTSHLQQPRDRLMNDGGELCGVSKAGDRIPVEVGLGHFESSGEMFVVATVVDVSASRAEIETTKMAINAAASAMVLVDDQGRVVLANQQTCATFGYDLPDLLGRPIEILLPEEHRERHRTHRGHFSSRPTKRAMGPERELYGRRRDGSRVPLEIGLTPVEYRGRQLVMATMIDITDRKAAESEILQKNNSLTRINQELSQFAYGASHDLQAPLDTVQGFLLCIEEDAADGDWEAVIANAQRAMTVATDLSRLIQDILAFARSESLIEDQREVTVADLVDRIIEHHSAALNRRGVSAEILIDADCLVSTQPTRLARVFDNLIGNAIKYSDAEKPNRFVRVSAARENGRLVASVEDNGIGLPADAADSVFVMFTRFTNHTEPGSGLGLALVRQNLDHLGGTIAWRDTGTGTRFDFEVPAEVDR